MFPVKNISANCHFGAYFKAIFKGNKKEEKAFTVDRIAYLDNSRAN